MMLICSCSDLALDLVICYFFCCERGQSACIVGFLWDQTIKGCIRKLVNSLSSNNHIILKVET